MKKMSETNKDKSVKNLRDNLRENINPLNNNNSYHSSQINNNSNNIFIKNKNYILKANEHNKKHKPPFVKKIKEILLLRIAIENIQIDDDTLEEEIKSNLELLELDKYDIKVINNIVDNLVDIIKQNINLKQNKLTFEKKKKINNNIDGKDPRRQTLDGFRSTYRTIAEEVDENIRNRTIEVILLILFYLL